MPHQVLDIRHDKEHISYEKDSSTIYVCPLRNVKSLISTTQTTHLITLMDANWDVPTPRHIAPSNHLKLIMSDTHNNKPGKITPNKIHIEKLIHFIENWHQSGPLLIHCLAGISRSTAAAFITQCLLNPNHSEEKIALQMRHASNTAAPNQAMIELADKIMRRKGRMLSAIKELPRARKAKVGRTFTLPAILE